MELLGPKQREKMRRAGRVAAETLQWVGEQLRAGMTTADIDRLVREDTARRGGTPAQLGYQGFPAAVCTSRNHVVCHGIPSPREVLADGDIVNVDVTTYLDGFHGDTSRTFLIGDVNPEARALVDGALACLHAGINAAHPGARLGDVGAAIEAQATALGFSVVRELGGHGIGRRMHMEPHVHHFGTAGRGARLQPGMAFTVEPMINAGGADVSFLADGWTVVTQDGTLSAQFEHTLLITEHGVEILTALT